MKEKLIYFLTFVHPKTQEVLFNPKGKCCIQYRTHNLPRVGDDIQLDFELSAKDRRGYTHIRTYRLDFKVVSVSRYIRAHTPQYEKGSPTYFDESTSFSVSVIPTTKQFTGTIRLLRKFYDETSAKCHEWLRNRREASE